MPETSTITPLKELMVSIEVASAIAGCFWWESTVNPGVWESFTEPSDTWFHDYQYDGIGGYGFGQFTNVGGSWRCRDYYLWCVDNGYEPDDGAHQIEYIVTVEKVWYDNSRRTGATTLEEFLESKSDNLEDLVYDWLANWEGVEGDRYSERLEHAQIFLEFIREHKDDDKTKYEWVKGNFPCTEEQSANNALMMYWALGGYDSGGGGKKRNKMPIWLMMKPRHSII